MNSLVAAPVWGGRPIVGRDEGNRPGSHARDGFSLGNLAPLFAHTDTSQAKGMEFLGRFMARSEDRDAPTSLTLRDAQYDAIVGPPTTARCSA